MDRIRVELPEFHRLIWVSEEAKSVWLPRFQKISGVWELIERLAVIANSKIATLQAISPDYLPELMKWGLTHDLGVMPLSRQGIGDGYQNATIPFQDGKPWNYRVVIARRHVLPEFIEAWNANDDVKIGELLGYPKCCQAFYKWSWVDQGWRDVALTMSIDSEQASKLDFPKEIRCTGFFQNNVLLRHLGLRMVSHLPCSLLCARSVRVANEFIRIAKAAEFKAEMHWLREILSWPLRWSSLHGVAIVTTPVVKIVYNTDALSEKVEILKDGEAYPSQGGRGEFPFRETVHLVNTSLENGFITQEAMDNAHAMIMEGVLSLKIPDDSLVVDMGCGNGRLLEAIADVSKIISVGIESDGARFSRAVKRFEGKAARIHRHSIFHPDTFNDYYYLVLISLNRLLEGNADEVKELLKQLKTHADHVMFYSYVSSDWPGYPGLTNDFVLEKFIKGQSSCAALMRPMKVEIGE